MYVSTYQLLQAEAIAIGQKQATSSIEAEAVNMINDGSSALLMAALEKENVTGNAVNQEGQTIQFQLGKVLGEGAFGKVYEAMDKSTGQIYAVKYIPLRSQQAKASAASFLKEIQLMEQLPHANIVRLIGSSVYV